MAESAGRAAKAPSAFLFFFFFLMSSHDITPSAKTKPYLPGYIFHGNCLNVMQRFPERSIGLVVTDPPYLVNYQSRDGRKVPNDNTSAWLEPAFKEVARVLKPHHYCISFYGWSHAEKFLSAWKNNGLYPVAHLVWAKNYTSRVGIVEGRHEQAYILSKGTPAPPRKVLPDVLPWKYSGNKLHPAQKSVAVLKPIIEAFSQPGDIVLDPFMGSGSTVAAAKGLRRRFIGIELDEKYFRIAKTRLNL